MHHSCFEVGHSSSKSLLQTRLPRDLINKFSHGSSLRLRSPWLTSSHKLDTPCIWLQHLSGMAMLMALVIDRCLGLCARLQSTVAKFT